MGSKKSSEAESLITIYPSVWKLILLTCVWVFVLAVIVWIGRQVPIGLISVPVFAWGVIYGVARLAVWRPMLVVGEDGVWANPFLGHGQCLTWDEVKSIGVFKRVVMPYGFPTFRYVGITPRDTEQWVERYPDWWQPFVRWYVGQVAAAIMIPQHMVPLSAEQIVGRIAARFSGPIHSHRVDVQKQARWY
jgi:hypothetical protein